MGEKQTRIVFQNHFSDFKVYPQPATNTLNIALEKTNVSAIITIKIYDLLGHTVMNKKIEQNATMEFDVSALQSGLYMMSLQNENSAEVRMRRIGIK